jgi:hypothetical protein
MLRYRGNNKTLAILRTDLDNLSECAVIAECPRGRNTPRAFSVAVAADNDCNRSICGDDGR